MKTELGKFTVKIGDYNCVVDGWEAPSVQAIARKALIEFFSAAAERLTEIKGTENKEAYYKILKETLEKLFDDVVIIEKEVE